MKKANFPLNKRDLPLTGPQAAALMYSFNATRHRQGHGADGARAFAPQTLNLTWMISPSRITYSLPSRRSLPASRTFASERSAAKSS